MDRRNTVQKKLVLDAVNQLKCHATAEDIYDFIVRTHPSISRGTVYRNLNVLAEDGEIRRIEIPGSADHYDHICEKHYHVLCIKCSKVFDVDMEPVPGLMKKKKIPKASYFSIATWFSRASAPSAWKKKLKTTTLIPNNIKINKKTEEKHVKQVCRNPDGEKP